MVDLDYWGDLAQRAFVNSFPSTNWANRMVEPWKGLPFGANLHSTPPRRARALTGPVEAPQDSLWSKLQVFSSAEPVQQTHEQEASQFLSKLPLDVRMIIYEMVLGKMIFHLESKSPSGRIITEICHRPDRIDEPSHQCHDPTSRHSSSSAATRSEFREPSDLMPLLLTCRRVYSEVIPILYATNTFEFRQGKVAFLFLRTIIPAPRLQSIRHFRLHMRLPHHPCINSRSRRDWVDMFQFFIDEMPGLQTFYLRLLTNYVIETQIKETDDADGADWTKPMILMAVEANQRNGCKVRFVTPSVAVGATHDCVRIFRETRQTTGPSSQERIVELAAIALHERIRLSLEGQG